MQGGKYDREEELELVTQNRSNSEPDCNSHLSTSGVGPTLVARPLLSPRVVQILPQTNPENDQV